MMENNLNDESRKKGHKVKSAGGKIGKKKKLIAKTTDVQDKNPKAFTFKSAVKAEQRFRRKQDIETKKQHVPVVDHIPVEPPPLLVAVVGPPKVGKTTLIINLVKLFTKTPLTDIKGPVTLVMGKKQRITLMECNNDINSMIDLAKVADLVLLLCDASFGFEMEFFEFLNICQVHGMPKVIGVLTHLDMIRNHQTLKNTKKVLKHRFWTEVYPGAKLFYLSGIIHGEYLKNEIKNLGRFISITKLRPLTWRMMHSYLLVDRLEDITSQELVRRDQKCNRNILLYGYLRGVPLNKENYIHIAGVGDQKIHSVTSLNDPCPLPEKKKRALIEKEKLVYAPFSGLGGIVYDKDAVYVELRGSHSYAQQKDDESYTVSANLLDTKETLDIKMKHSTIQIFSHTESVVADDIVMEDSKIDDTNEIEFMEKLKDNITDNMKSKFGNNWDGKTVSLEVTFDNNVLEKTMSSINFEQNLMKLIYDHTLDDIGEENLIKKDSNQNNNIGNLFMLNSNENQKQKMKDLTMDLSESSLPSLWNLKTNEWVNQNQNRIKNCFVTGKWRDNENAEELLKLDDLRDFDSDVEDERDGTVSFNNFANNNDNAHAEITIRKKLELKRKFNTEYDNFDKDGFYNELKTRIEKQSELNKEVFSNMDEDVRVEIEGCRPGMYIKLELRNMPAEFINNFEPSYPIVIGALNMGEENIGYVNVKLKKHRWYNKILKTNDPVIVSMGWRRFQTLPLYFKLEDDLKCRFLKYTPQHVSCHAQFWGPVTPQNTGFLAIQNVQNHPEILKEQGFRVVATGTVSELDQSTKILKKLKLVGNPIKIYKKTAFISGMFNSSLEVAKFESAKIKTVSGIRGQVKKSIRDNGTFRATFEDKIQLSDVVVCRTWCAVDVPKFYCPITNLLLPKEKKDLWKGVKALRELKVERNIKEQPSTDSMYTAITWNPIVFKPLVIPKKLQVALPYKDKPKNGILSKNNDKKIERVAVVREKEERKIMDMLKMLKTTYEYKQLQQAVATKKRIEKQLKEKELEELRKKRKIQSQKKTVMRLKSKENQH